MFRITLIIILMMIIVILMMIILIIFDIVFIIFGGRLMQGRDSALEPGQWKAEECEFAFFRLLFLKSSVLLHQGRIVAKRGNQISTSNQIVSFHLQVNHYKPGKHSKSKYFSFRHGRLLIIMILMTYRKNISIVWGGFSHKDINTSKVAVIVRHVLELSVVNN